jgi:hypothetical protein
MAKSAEELLEQLRAEVGDEKAADISGKGAAARQKVGIFHAILMQGVETLQMSGELVLKALLAAVEGAVAGVVDVALARAQKMGAPQTYATMLAQLGEGYRRAGQLLIEAAAQVAASTPAEREAAVAELQTYNQLSPAEKARVSGRRVAQHYPERAAEMIQAGENLAQQLEQEGAGVGKVGEGKARLQGVQGSDLKVMVIGPDRGIVH